MGITAKETINTFNVALNEDRTLTLVKESSFSCESKRITSPELIVRVLNDVFNLGNRAEEYFYMLAVNVKGEITGTFLISQGDLSATIIHPREVFKRALLCNAAAVVFAHNHPSGDPEPSSDDISTTRKLVEAGKILGVSIWDHIIVGHGRFRSFREEQLI
jgi:DNA repair protein RadC